jgi:hypothetical protein
MFNKREIHTQYSIFRLNSFFPACGLLTKWGRGISYISGGCSDNSGFSRTVGIVALGARAEGR